MREVEEETGCPVALGSLAGCTAYYDKGRPKIVIFWNMTATAVDNFQPNDEIDQMVWLPVAEAMTQLSYESEKSLLKGQR